MPINSIQHKVVIQEDRSLEELQWLCRSVLHEAFPLFHNAKVEASFYPYVGLTHTIRRKKTGWVVRISDLCRHAPRQVLEAIIMILGCKVTRRRPRQEYVRTYELFRREPWVAGAVRERRMKRGRKNLGGEAGRYYSLGRIYKELNNAFFNNQIDIARIGWGLRSGRKRMGHYDPIHHTITLSPVLDSAGVPEFVVRYIVYHEMLHALYESALSGARKRHHSAQFRRAESAFPDYAKAKKFLGEYCGRLH